MMDLDGLALTDSQIDNLVTATGPHSKHPGSTFSDIRTRLYPAALAKAFPDQPLSFKHLHDAATSLRSSPVLKDI
jgi:hypothetical protein